VGACVRFGGGVAALSSRRTDMAMSIKQPLTVNKTMHNFYLKFSLVPLQIGAECCHELCAHKTSTRVCVKINAQQS
jgi:hypothetical protein